MKPRYEKPTVTPLVRASPGRRIIEHLIPAHSRVFLAVNGRSVFDMDMENHTRAALEWVPFAPHDQP